MPSAAELRHHVNGWLDSFRSPKPQRSRSVKVQSKYLEDEEEDLHNAASSLTRATMRALEKQLREAGFKGAQVSAWGRGEAGGFTVHYQGQGYRFAIEETSMQPNSKGIYFDTGLDKNDMVISQDHRGRFTLDLITTAGGNHLTIGSTRGFASAEEAFGAALAEQHRRGLRGKTHVWIQNGDGYVDYEPKGDHLPFRGAHHPNGRRSGNQQPARKFKVGDRVVRDDDSARGEVVIYGNYDDYIGCYRIKVQQDNGPRIWWNESSTRHELEQNPRKRKSPRLDSRAERIRREWDEAEQKGLVRMVSEPELENYFDVYGEPDSAEERREIEDRIDRDGVWMYAAQYLSQDTGEWETADSIGMIFGDINGEGSYEIDLKESALQNIYGGHRPNARRRRLGELPPKPAPVVDEHAARELSLYIENDYALIGAPNSRGKSIDANLRKKVAAGKYDPELAPVLWEYLIEEGARKYAKEYSEGHDWSRLFPKALREQLAVDFARAWEEENGVRGMRPNMANTYWNIDSGDGNELTAGIQLESEARRIAQRMANERGESVYLYEVGNGDGESEVESEEIEPEVE